MIKLLRKPLRLVEVILWLETAITILTPNVLNLGLIGYIIITGLFVSPLLLSIAFIRNRFRRYKIPLYIALFIVAVQTVRLIISIFRGAELVAIQQAINAISFYLIVPLAIFLKKDSK